MSEELTLTEVSPYDPGVAELIRQLDKYQQELYPAESNHLDSLEVLSESNCRLVAAYKNADLIGIGAAKLCDGYGELKRFLVPEPLRGQGIAESIVGALEKWLMEQQVLVSRLETGIHQHAAIRFYQKMGYTPTAPFGGYSLDPLSVFMEKRLRSR